MSHPAYAWHRVTFEGAKTHTVPGFLLEDLIAEMTARGHEPRPIVPPEHATDRTPVEFRQAVRRLRDRWALDPGGMLHVHEPWVTFRVDNLAVTVRACTVRDYARSLRQHAVRWFASGRPYVKLHGSWHCLVVTPRQHSLLVAALGDATSRAEAESLAFFRDKPTHDEVLRGAAAAVTGIPAAAVPRLAESPSDRFAHGKAGKA